MGSMLVHTSQYQNPRGLLTNGDIKKFIKFIHHKHFEIELKTVRKWFQQSTICTGLDLKDVFLHVPMSAWVKKFLRFKWRGKLYEWQVLPFGLKYSPRILTNILAPIVKFLCGRT